MRHNQTVETYRDELGDESCIKDPFKITLNIFISPKFLLVKGLWAINK